MSSVKRRKPKTRKPADWVIQQRRAQEAKRDELQAQVDYNFVVGSRSHWENKTQKVIEKNRALRRYALLVLVLVSCSSCSCSSCFFRRLPLTLD